MIAFLHDGIATATKTPEMALEAAEAQMLATASANVLAQFDIQPDPKTQAIFGLIVAGGTVYAPRMVAIRMRHASERRNRPAATPATAFPSVPFPMAGG